MSLLRARNLSIALGVLLFASQLSAADSDGRVIVLDGDTIELDGRVIDLAGIDAPEFGQRCRRGETEVDCGMIARTQLLDLTAGSDVTCDFAGGVARAGWPAVAVCRANGYDLSEGMLHTGWALVDADAATSERYAAVQAASREAGRGLWGFAFVEPWEWRRGLRLGTVDQQ